MTKLQRGLILAILLCAAIYGQAFCASKPSSPAHSVKIKLVFAPGSTALPGGTLATLAPFCNRPIAVMFMAPYSPASPGSIAFMPQREQAVVVALTSCGATLQIVGYGTEGAQPLANADTLIVLVNTE